MIDCKETLELALGAMKRVTEMVNEGRLTYNIMCLGIKFITFIKVKSVVSWDFELLKVKRLSAYVN